MKLISDTKVAMRHMPVTSGSQSKHLGCTYTNVINYYSDRVLHNFKNIWKKYRINWLLLENNKQIANCVHKMLYPGEWCWISSAEIEKMDGCQFW